MPIGVLSLTISTELAMKTMQPRSKLWLNCGNIEGAFGDGKWRLLDAIAEQGSLRAASQVLGISYRKAWGDLAKTQTALGITLVEKERGGIEGGKTTLTDDGRKWLAAYTAFRTDVEKAINEAFARHFPDVMS